MARGSTSGTAELRVDRMVDRCLMDVERLRCKSLRAVETFVLRRTACQLWRLFNGSGDRLLFNMTRSL